MSGCEYLIKNIDRKSLISYGNLDSIFSVRQIKYTSGNAKDLTAYEVINCGMRFTVYCDKCLDIGEMYYYGTPVHYHACGGILNGQKFYDGDNSSHSVMGGMMFTCGLSNVGPYEKTENGSLPQHGFLRNTASELHGAAMRWDGDNGIIEISGTIREASLYGTNLVVRRVITTVLGSDAVSVRDEIENESPVNGVPAMLLYHINCGFPFLTENAFLKADYSSMSARDNAAARGMEKQSPLNFTTPACGTPEQVFYYDMIPDERGICTVELHSPDCGCKMTLSYDCGELPAFAQWKSMDAVNYVCGLEPANCRPEGYLAQRESVRRLKPFEKFCTSLELVFSKLC